MSSSTANLNQLFGNALDEGALSAGAAAVIDVDDLGAAIQMGMGIGPDDVKASEVILVSKLIDDSGSIRFLSGGAEAVRNGSNLVDEALLDSKQTAAILTHTRYLNGTVLNPYVALANAIKMDKSNYNPIGGTPLFDQVAVFLGTVIAKTQEFSDSGVPVRTVSLFVTDGADEHSVRCGAKDVAKLVRDMLARENHIVAAMGIDDGRTDFRRVFQDMGILDEWILTPKNTATDIRRAFQVFSQSAVRASQSAAAFSKTALGGFGS